MRSRQLSVAVLLAAGLFSAQVAISQESQRADPGLTSVIELYRQQGPVAAVPEFERLLLKFESAGNEADSAITLAYLGDAHRRLGVFEEALDYFERALSAQRSLSDSYQEGRTLNGLGLVYWEMGDYEQALAQFDLSQAIAKALDNKQLQGAVLNNISLVYDELGDYPASLAQYQQVLRIYREANLPHGESDTLGNIGGVNLLLGRYREALDYYQQALVISENLGLKPSMSQDLGNLALGHLGLGHIDEALELFDRAMSIASEAGLRQDEAYWLRGKGNALIKHGRYDLGLQNHRRALDIYEEVGAAAELLETLHDLGRLHILLGDPVSGERYFQRALEMARSIKLDRGITSNLLALGDLQHQRQLYESATALYDQALERARKSNAQGELAESLLRISLVLRDQQEFGKSTDAAQQALTIARQNEARGLEAEALYALAELDRRRGAHETALTGFRATVQIAAQLGDPEVLWKTKYGQAQVLDQLGQTEEALQILKETAELIEGIRIRLQEQRFQVGYVQNKSEVYVELVRLLLKLGRLDEAFSASERLRTWSYLEILERRQTVAIGVESSDRELELRGRIEQLQKALVKEESKKPAERRQRARDVFSRELVLAEREYQSFLEDLQSTSSRLSAENIPTYTEIRLNLAADEALIEFVVGKDGVTAFVLTPNTLYAISTPLTRNELTAKIKLLRNLIRRNDSNRWEKPAASLSSTLFEPIEAAGWLEGVTHLYLVPHGILNLLPFAVLPSSQPESARRILDDYTLKYLPSARFLADRVPRLNSPFSLLAIAPTSTQLVHAPEEARTIDALFRPRSRLLVGNDATESSFKRLAPNYRVLHLATHGGFNKLNPLLSGLEFEPDELNDGLLQVHEILRLRLDAELVTLSACRTGLNSGYFAELPAGDAFVGLTRAFLQAGSRSVLATLWEVDDRSTVDLMRSFYRRFIKRNNHEDKAIALTVAQRELRDSERYNHPYYWAPFVLIGATS